MPYISQRDRLRLLDQMEAPHSAGELNYCITRLIDGWLLQDNQLSYDRLNEAIGVLECAKLELYRRVAAPYEDTKILKNGDVYSERAQ
jgi:hypothetical protein